MTHDHAGERYRPTASEQVAGTMFDALVTVPVPSQPRRGSEHTADRLMRSRPRISKERMVLERLERGPVTVDRYIQELRKLAGDDTRIERSSYAPRFTMLMNAGYAAYDDSEAHETTMHGTACPYCITDAGRREVAKRRAMDREREARRLTAGGSFGPDQRTAA